MKKIKPLLIISLFFILSGTVSAFEIERFSSSIDNSFAVQPSKVEIDVSAGGTARFDIFVENRFDVPASFVITVETIISGRAGNISLGNSYDSKHLSLRPDSVGFILSQGERARMNIVVDVSPEAFPGGLFAAVVVAGKPIGDDSSNGDSGLSSRIGVPVFVRVDADDAISTGRLLNFSQRGDSLDIEFRNDGNLHLNPYGVVKITGYFGLVDETVNIDPWFVLPGSSRTKSFSLPDLPPGYYSASILQNRGYGDVIDSAGVSLVILPEVNGSIILLVILLASLLIWRITHKIKSNA